MNCNMAKQNKFNHTHSGIMFQDPSSRLVLVLRVCTLLFIFSKTIKNVC